MWRQGETMAQSMEFFILTVRKITKSGRLVVDQLEEIKIQEYKHASMDTETPLKHIKEHS
jgi:hypothetical protein